MNCPLLRLTHTTVGKRSRVEISLEMPGQPRQTASCAFNFKLSDLDNEEIRWYLEDYLNYPDYPALQIATRIEHRMSEIGVELFNSIFQADEDARDLWATLREKLADTRVEVISTICGATSVPWELIRDPKTDTPLALRASSFVRAHPQTQQRPKLPTNQVDAVRILLIICRPGGADDVPFRSVANRILRGLRTETRTVFQLDVLRPPTFEQLALQLRQAKEIGQPYHIVHFDGHGDYLDEEAVIARNHLLISCRRDGSHGYLIFENPATPENLQLVDGPTLGKLLVETDVPFLILNACRSAHALPPAEPEKKHTATNVHDAIRSLGSLAQETADSGVPGIVAMRYSVYVVTAAQFIADLYAGLARGQSLGYAVTLGRKQLNAQPLRTTWNPIPLQDWCVPIVYEAAPIVLFPTPLANAPLLINLDSYISKPTICAEEALPPTPDAGFFGRDETLLAIDRAFDKHHVVLLFAFAGSGKTACASEFARWYTTTGGIIGPVFFTSFHEYRPLAKVLDQFERVFGAELEKANVHWLTLSADRRREIALQVLKQVPVLWVWDNVEQVAGFPAGTTSAWNNEEIQELVDFLRAAQNSKAKFLLTSRRSEQSWLGNLSVRVKVPPMPIQESIQLVNALATKYGNRLSSLHTWLPLIEFASGNPLTITVVVGQALLKGLKTREENENFVEALRSGEALFQDEISEGRSKSLGASLSYGFENAFSDNERRVLALLYLFRGFVNAVSLYEMGRLRISVGEDYSLPEVRAITIGEVNSLLNRSQEIGLLTAYSEGYYAIHPVLNWFFKNLFEKNYPTSDEPCQVLQETNDSIQLARLNPSQILSPQSDRLSAIRAFALAMGKVSVQYRLQLIEGERNFIHVLHAEEANLLNANLLSRTNDWWWAITSTMKGLQLLYEYDGRRSEWKTLVDEATPFFIDPVTDGPLTGREKQWFNVMEFRVQAAIALRQFEDVERIQNLLVKWRRKAAESALAAPESSLDDSGRDAILALATSLGQLGNVFRELNKPRECLAAHIEDYALSQRYGGSWSTAQAAFGLGHAYVLFPSIRDLSKAEQCYQKSLDLRDKRDWLGRAKCLNQLGHVSLEHFYEAKVAQHSNDELLQHLNLAINFYHQGMKLLPVNAYADLAVANGRLGEIYSLGGYLTEALKFFQEAIRCAEMGQDLHVAGQMHFNMALTLAHANRFSDALTYAHAALKAHQANAYGSTKEIQETQQLIKSIKQEGKAYKK